MFRNWSTTIAFLAHRASARARARSSGQQLLIALDLSDWPGFFISMHDHSAVSLDQACGRFARGTETALPIWCTVRPRALLQSDLASGAITWPRCDKKRKDSAGDGPNAETKQGDRDLRRTISHGMGLDQWLDEISANWKKAGWKGEMVRRLDWPRKPARFSDRPVFCRSSSGRFQLGNAERHKARWKAAWPCLSELFISDGGFGFKNCF